MEKHQKLRSVLSVLAVLLAFAAIIGLVTRLLEPKYMTDLEEGSFISQYYDEAGGHVVSASGYQGVGTGVNGLYERNAGH